MTEDEIISMAHVVGVVEFLYSNPHLSDAFEFLQRFAALVAAAEREACADILDRNCDKCDPHSIAYEVLDSNAKAIRARGQH